MGFEDIVMKDDLSSFEKRILEAIKDIATPKPKWLNLEEAAAYIRDAPGTLGNKARAGEIPHIKDGARLKFFVDDLDKHMLKHRIKSNDEIKSMVAGL